MNGTYYLQIVYMVAAFKQIVEYIRRAGNNKPMASLSTYPGLLLGRQSC